MRRQGISSLRAFAAAAALAFVLPVCARAASDDSDAPDARAMFRAGRVEIDAGAGIGVFNSKDYALLLLGGGYYVADGVSVAVLGEAWVGPQPQIYDVSPQVRYIFLDSPWRFKPFVGAFYRRTFYDHDYPPIDSLGGRAGLVFPLNERAYLTGDVAFEHYFDCDKSVYTSCDQAYPEIGLAFSF